MRITREEKKAFYRSIPVYPREMTKREIADMARISYTTCSVLSHQIPYVSPICESDSGRLSFISQHDKNRFLANLWQQCNYEEIKCKKKTEDARAVSI